MKNSLSVTLALILFSTGSYLFASEEPSAETFTSEEAPKEERVVIKEAQGIILVNNPSQLLQGEELEEVHGLQAIGMEIPGGIEKLNAYLTPIYLHQPLTTDKILEIKNAISKYYKEQEIPFVAVQVPAQDVTSERLQFVVVTSNLGEIKVSGNRWFSSKHIKGFIRVRPGQPMNERVLVKNLSLINRSPFMRVDLVYSPGTESGTTDITLLVKDRKPLRLYAGTDNTGIQTTGEQRIYAGFNYGNLFGLGHIFSYQYTSSYDFNKFQAHTADYLAPLSWGHLLHIYGGYSYVHAHLTFPGTRNHGQSGQASLRYTIPLNPGCFLLQDVSFGGDFKRTNNTVEFVEFGERFGKNVNLTQVVLGYTGDYQKTRYKIDYQAQLYWSPGKWLADQSNVDYESLRPGAKNHWVYGTAMARYMQRIIWDWSISLYAQGQLSDQNLLPSEQIGIGGYNTVRGYEERQLSMDNGVIASGELRTPAWHIFRSCNRDALQLLAFFDYGYGWDHNAIPGLPKNQYLMGTGPGLRYTLDPYLTVRFDWGIKLHKKEFFQGGPTHIHFAVVASY